MLHLIFVSYTLWD